jgi:septum formation protein
MLDVWKSPSKLWHPRTMSKSPHDSRLVSVNQLLLGSTSPFRRKLLEASGVAFGAAAPNVDEAAISADRAETLAMARAIAKARAVAAAHPGALVIGGDQVLGLDGKTFDKAQTAGEARERLRLFAGRTHHLHSAVALAYGDRLVHEELVSVAMPMRRLSEAELDAYVATGEWRGSVGCYQYEHRGVHLFSGVRGDQSAIVGLPLQELLAALRALGLDALVKPEPPWTIRLPLS